MQLLPATYSTYAAVTKSDSTQLNCRAIYVGGAGNIALSVNGVADAVTITGVAAGTFLPIALDGGRIMSTNTTATAIVALA
jgi:hypothetical protein